MKMLYFGVCFYILLNCLLVMVFILNIKFSLRKIDNDDIACLSILILLQISLIKCNKKINTARKMY